MLTEKEVPVIREEEDEDDTQSFRCTKDRRDGCQKIDSFLVGTKFPNLLEKVIQFHVSEKFEASCCKKLIWNKYNYESLAYQASCFV